MKNIHVLPTDKPSRLHLWTDENGSKLALCDLKFSNTRNTQNIYITSDEELKMGDWVLNIEENTILKPSNDEIYDIENSEAKYYEFIKKIILTTDQDLINDGIQALDDEFLKWFVENQSCEQVEVVDDWNSPRIDAYEYKIIIPKEEPKIIECYFTPKKDTSSATICDNCGKEKFLHTIGSGIKLSTYIINQKEELNQELPIGADYMDEFVGCLDLRAAEERIF